MRMSKTTLVVLAAGFGSRFGSTKQLESVGPEGSLLIDYSVFDAVQAGFGKIVFVVREEILDEFKKHFEQKLRRAGVEAHFVVQEIESIPSSYLPSSRKKPWGTGQALLAARGAVSENMSVVNADDFYGRASYLGICNWLQSVETTENRFSMVGFPISNTLSPYGSVSRGLCAISEAGLLERIDEQTRIYKRDDEILYVDVEEAEHEIAPDTVVSMNMWGFTPRIFEHLEKDFEVFLGLSAMSPDAEFYLPMTVNRLVSDDQGTVEVIRSTSKWMGLTYKQDRAGVEKSLTSLHTDGEYPRHLWK